MKDFSIASIGDCCVDIYPDEKKWFLGGTAFNVAVHARKAGAQASLVSAVGTDTYGKMFYEQCRKLGISTDCLTTFEGITSSIEIPLDAQGSPIFSGWELGVLSQLILTPIQQKFIAKHTVARGILLKPLKGLFRSFCDMHIPDTVKVGDFAGGSQYSVEKEEILEYIQGLDIIVRSVSPMERFQTVPYSDELTFLKDIAQRHNKIVLALLGKEGSIVFTKEKTYKQPAVQTHVTDTTGAGDAYIAYFLVEYLSSHNIQLAMEKATKAASEVITQWGASTI